MNGGFDNSDRVQEHLYKVLVIGDFGVGKHPQNSSFQLASYPTNV